MGIRNGRTCQTGDETHKEDTFMKTPGRHRIVVAAMNTLMVMLDNRDYGIPAKTASMLFDYCNLVAPAKYHDVSRHQRADRGSDTAQSTVDTGGFDNGGGDSF